MDLDEEAKPAKRKSAAPQTLEPCRFGRQFLPAELEEVCFELASDASQYKALTHRCSYLLRRSPAQPLEPSQWKARLSEQPLTEHHATFLRRQQEERQETPQSEAADRAAIAGGIPGIRCSKCKGSDIRFEIVQMRSADEGSTVFCTCAACHKRWRM